MKTSLLLAAALLSATASASAQSLLPTPPANVLSVNRYQVAAQPCRTQQVAGGGSITYFEAMASHDAQLAQFEQLRQAFEASQPTVVFFEHPDCGTDSTAAATIGRLGEAGYVRLLAQQHHVPAERLDDPLAEYSYLQDQVGPEQFKLYYVLRLAQQFKAATGASKALTSKAVQQLLAHSDVVFPGTGLAIQNLTELQAAYHKFCPGFGEWWNVPATWFEAQPTAERSPLADLNRAACAFRQAAAYRKLLTKAQAGERVFVVVEPGQMPTGSALTLSAR